MFRLPFSNEPTDLDRAITAVHARMYKLDLDDDEYPTLLSHLERLEKLKNEERSKQISRDTMVIVGGQLLGILVIVAYESRHVMTSKALDFVQKTKA
jgi:hypothetical protein